MEAYLDDVLRSGDEAAKARARLVRVELAWQSGSAGSLDSALAEAAAIAAEIERLGDPTGLIEARLVMGRLAFFFGRVSEAEDAYAEAARLARAAGDRRLLDEATEWLIGAKLYGSAPIAEGMALTREVLADARRGRRLECFALTSLGVFEAAQGRFDEGRALTAQGLAVAEEFGVVIRRGVHTLQAAEVELLAGDLEAAERHIREGDEILRRVGETGFRSTVLGYLADVLARLGRAEEARHVLAELGQIVQAGDFEPEARTRIVRARLAAAAGDLGAAEALTREALEILDGRDYLETKMEALVVLSEVLAAAGERDEAVALAAEAAKGFERRGNIVSAARARELAERLAVPAGS